MTNPKTPRSRPPFIPPGYRFFPDAVIEIEKRAKLDEIRQRLYAGELAVFKLEGDGTLSPVDAPGWANNSRWRAALRLGQVRGPVAGGLWLFVKEIDVERAACEEPESEEPEPESPVADALSPREMGKLRTAAKYEDWFRSSIKIQAEGRWTRRSDIARQIKKGYHDVEVANIIRRLNKFHPTWPNPAKES